MNYGTASNFNPKVQQGASAGTQLSLKRPPPLTGNLIPNSMYPGKQQGPPPTPLNHLLTGDSSSPEQGAPFQPNPHHFHQNSAASSAKKGPIRPKHQILTSKPKQPSGNSNAHSGHNMFTIRQHSNSVSRPRTVGTVPQDRDRDVLGVGSSNREKPNTGGMVRVRPSSLQLITQTQSNLRQLLPKMHQALRAL